MQSRSKALICSVFTMIAVLCSCEPLLAQAPPVPDKAPAARFVSTPGQPLDKAHLAVWDSTGIAFVEYQGEQIEPHALGYVTLDVPWGVDETEHTVSARVVANDGTERTINLHLERPLEFRDVSTQSELDDALASMSQGGVINLAPNKTWQIRDTPEVTNRWIWITSPEGAAFIVGDGSGDTWIGAPRLGFKGCTLDLTSIGQFVNGDNDELSFVECSLSGKIGTRWVPAVIVGDAGAGQKFYFYKCHLQGQTSYGFTDATTVSFCRIDAYQADAFQSSLGVFCTQVDLVYDSGNGHHKDLYQSFHDVENRMIMDVVLLDVAVNNQDWYTEDNLRIGQYDVRIDAVRDRYVTANSVTWRVQILQHDQVSPPQSRVQGLHSNCGMLDVVSMQGWSWKGTAANTNQFKAINGYVIDGLLCGFASSIEITGERFGTGGFAPGVSWDNVGVTELKWANSGYVPIEEGYPYTEARTYLGIVDPLTPDSSLPDPSPILVYDELFDITTAGAGEGDPGYLEPDGLITASDILAFTNLWQAGDLRADLTTQGASLSDPRYMVPDDLVTGADIGVYSNYWHINNGASETEPSSQGAE